MANALSVSIGHAIAKKSSTELSHLGGRATSKDLWNAVRKVKSRSRCENIGTVEGLSAELMNQHYQMISTDSAYIEPCYKQTVRTENAETFTEFQVYQLLHQLKRTATGLDKLPSWFLRLGAPVLSAQLTYLFNRALHEGIVPDQWITAYIRPVPKVATPTGPIDFRPISVTPVLSRTYEKLIVKQFIYPAMLDPPIELTFADQFAFRPAGSCTAAIIALLHTVSTMLLDNPYVIVITLDFSKAFDTVRHSALAMKLSLLNIPDGVYNWIVHFLVRHEHCTAFDGNMSSTVKVTASVIQGSVIGPGSYDVAASDLHPVVDGNKLVKFADDLTLIVPARNVDKRNTELQHVQSWSSANNLQLNCKKSQEIVFRKTKRSTVPIYS